MHNELPVLRQQNVRVSTLKGPTGWCRINAYGACQIPAKWRDWLLDQTSLTARLQTCCEGNLRVQVISQRVQLPMPSERRILRNLMGSHGLVREVLLFGAGQPLVHARTVMPRMTTRGPLCELRELGNQPLGTWLFAQPSIKRGAIEVARIDGAHMSGIDQEPQRAILWGRRSIFSVREQPLLVTEIFLPAFRELPKFGSGLSAQ